MKITGWLKANNRNKHFKYAILCGFCGTFLFALGVAVGMEFKDWRYGHKWDWADVAATLAGGLAGQALQILLAGFIFWAVRL